MCDARPAQIRVRNAEVVLLAGGDESAAGDGAADGAADVTVKDDAAQTLDNSQMSWVYSLVTQALANLIVDIINGLTFRVEMLRRVPAEADPAAAAAGGASAAAALEPQRPRHAERRRRCRLSLNGQVVEATPAGFGPTIEAVAAAHTVTGLAVLADPPLADRPLRNVDEIRGQIGVVERGSVSFVEKARRLQAAGAAAVLVLNVAEADYVPLGMVGDPGFDIAVPVVCVRRSWAEFLGQLANLGQPAAGVCIAVQKNSCVVCIWASQSNGSTPVAIHPGPQRNGGRSS